MEMKPDKTDREGMSCGPYTTSDKLYIDNMQFQTRYGITRLTYDSAVKVMYAHV